MIESALYIHIPFCEHKCIYCDFYSIITKDNITNYLYAIKKEIIHYSKKYSGDRVFSSIFFGGGTPSLMEPDYLESIILCLKEYYNISDDAEITLESNPGTVDKHRLEGFRRAGFNRISIGVQSFNDEELKFLTRIHNKNQAITTVNYALQVGFENINLDLIFNLPGQTKQMWISNLETAVELPVKHISAYSLILEKGTILNKWVKDGIIKIQDSDYDADIYYITMDYLKQKGFIQYEVSNFAKQDYECQHNKAYWHYKDYLSFGASSHSFIDGKRWWNYSSVKKYISQVNKLGNAVANSEDLTKEQMLDEYVMLALRSDGLNKRNLQSKFGSEWFNNNLDKLMLFEKEGLLIISDDIIKCTSKGYALCDKILESLA